MPRHLAPTDATGRRARQGGPRRLGSSPAMGKPQREPVVAGSRPGRRRLESSRPAGVGSATADRGKLGRIAAAAVPS